MKERLIFSISFANNRNLKYFNLLNIFTYLNLRIGFYEYSNIIIFKREESVKADVDSTHTQGACGGDSIDPPTVGVSHSPTIDAEYVFVSSNIVTILRLL